MPASLVVCFLPILFFKKFRTGLERDVDGTSKFSRLWNKISYKIFGIEIAFYKFTGI